MSQEKTISAIMSQAQVLASAWALVGSRFDDGSELANAEQAKEELRALVAGAIRPAAVTLAERTQQQAHLMALIEQYANAEAMPKGKTDAEHQVWENRAEGFYRQIEAIVCAPQADVIWPEPVAWRDAGDLRAGSKATSYRVVTQETKQGMPVCIAASFAEDLYTRAQVEALLAQQKGQA